MPAASPVTVEKVALGRKLMFDRRLSANGTLSCAMCHVPEQGFTNNELATPVGFRGQSIRRNAPALFNVAYELELFRDGRAATLEAQVLMPLMDPREMANGSLAGVEARLRALPDYAGLFEAAFDRPADRAGLAAAIAAYERTLLSADSAFDRWYFGGDSGALGAAAKAGFELFSGRAGCTGCHLVGERSALFTDHAFHDTGLGYRRDVIARRSRAPVSVELAPGVFTFLPRALVDSVGLPRQPDRGREEVTGEGADRYRYKTPSLRNVALTAPYMHDGSLTSLGDVVRFYDRGGYPAPGLDPALRPLGLDEAEIAALVAFLESLTGANVAELIADARSVGVGN